jgi:hypothetical protein
VNESNIHCFQERAQLLFFLFLLLEVQQMCLFRVMSEVPVAENCCTMKCCDPACCTSADLRVTSCTDVILDRSTDNLCLLRHSRRHDQLPIRHVVPNALYYPSQNMISLNALQPEQWQDAVFPHSCCSAPLKPEVACMWPRIRMGQQSTCMYARKVRKNCVRPRDSVLARANSGSILSPGRLTASKATKVLSRQLKESEMQHLTGPANKMM